MAHVYVLARYERINGRQTISYLKEFPSEAKPDYLHGVWTHVSDWALQFSVGDRDAIADMTRFLRSVPGDWKAAICLADLKDDGYLQLLVNPSMKDA